MYHQQSLLDVFSGLDKTKRSYTVESIKLHLMRLLNTRKESVPHLKEYGLPDLSTLYNDLPANKSFIIEIVQQTVLRYETRVKKLTITPFIDDTQYAILRLKMVAVLTNGEQLSCQANFLNHGVRIN